MTKRTRVIDEVSFLSKRVHRRAFIGGTAAAAGLLAMPGFVKRAAAEDVLEIGWVRPLTGPLVSSWAGHFAAAAIATDEINAAGGILGRKLVAVEVDDAGAPASQPLVMRELINRGVNIVVGPVGSSQTLASLAVSTPAKVLQAGYITASDGGDGDAYPYHYQFIFPVDSQSVAYADFIISKSESRKVGVLVEDSAAGTAVLEAMKRDFPERDLEIVGEQVAPLRSTDMTPFLRSLRSAGAEVLCCFVSNNIDVTQLFVGLQRLNWKPLMVGHTGLLFASTDGAVPDSAKYPQVYAASYRALTFTENEEPDERVKSFVSKLLERDLPESQLTVAATSPFYDFLHAMKFAAEETKSLDTEDIKSFLDEVENYQGLYGAVNFSAKDHTAYDHEAVALAQVFADDHPLLTESKGLFRPRG